MSALQDTPFSNLERIVELVDDAQESNEPDWGDAETALEYASGLGRESGRP